MTTTVQANALNRWARRRPPPRTLLLGRPFEASHDDVHVAGVRRSIAGTASLTAECPEHTVR